MKKYLINFTSTTLSVVTLAGALLLAPAAKADTNDLLRGIIGIVIMNEVLNIPNPGKKQVIHPRQVGIQTSAVHVVPQQNPQGNGCYEREYTYRENGRRVTDVRNTCSGVLLERRYWMD